MNHSSILKSFTSCITCAKIDIVLLYEKYIFLAFVGSWDCTGPFLSLLKGAF